VTSALDVGVPTAANFTSLKMAREKGPCDPHNRFVQWALDHGISINGVAPSRFPERGMGMVATRTIEVGCSNRFLHICHISLTWETHLKENEIMITVPVAAMLTIDRVPKSFVDRLPNATSTHAILAAFLTHGDTEELRELDPWRTVASSLFSIFRRC
jgi:hypothetical protein